MPAPPSSAPPWADRRVRVTADHDTVSTDFNDVSCVRTTVADSAGQVVTGSCAPITFSVSGLDVIVAVDSGSPIRETFRGSVRTAYQGSRTRSSGRPVRASSR